MNGSEEFFLTRVASSTSGRARNQLPISCIDKSFSWNLNSCIAPLVIPNVPNQVNRQAVIHFESADGCRRIASAAML